MSRWGSDSSSERRVSGHSVLGPGALDPRRELRRPATGPVTVRFGYQKVSEVRGSLVDVSASGFRMAHECITLETGQTVEFFHSEASGNARVVWNRIVDRSVETGFFVVQP